MMQIFIISEFDKEELEPEKVVLTNVAQISLPLLLRYVPSALDQDRCVAVVRLCTTQDLRSRTRSP